MKKVLAMVAILSTLCCFTACNSSTTSTGSTASVRGADETVASEVSADEANDVSSEDEADDVSSEEELEPIDDAFLESAYDYEGVLIQLPEGFTESDRSTDTITIFQSPNYPSETDNINFTNTNESISTYTEANINKTMETLFDGYEGCEDYKQYKIDGCDAVSYHHTITVSDVALSTNLSFSYIYFN